MKMTVAQAIVEIMCKEGIHTAFGIPGAAINPVYKYMENAPIEHFTMRHEEACVHAADGYQRAKNEIALAICSRRYQLCDRSLHRVHRFHARTLRSRPGQCESVKAGAFPVCGYAGHC